MGLKARLGVGAEVNIGRSEIHLGRGELDGKRDPNWSDRYDQSQCRERWSYGVWVRASAVKVSRLFAERRGLSLILVDLNRLR